MVKNVVKAEKTINIMKSQKIPKKSLDFEVYISKKPKWNEQIEK